MTYASRGRGGLVSKIIAGATLVDLRKELVAAATDLLGSTDATSDQRTEGNAVAGWTGSDAALSSIANATLGVGYGTYCMKVLGNAGDASSVGEAQQEIVTVAGKKYTFRGYIWTPSANTITTNPLIKIGTTAGGAEIVSVPVQQYPGWCEVLFEFVATGIATHITIYGALDTEAIYADNVSVTLTEGLSPVYIYPVGMTVVKEWQSAEFLEVTQADGSQVTLTNLASKAFQADLYYPIPGWAFINSSGATETGTGNFEIIVHY